MTFKAQNHMERILWAILGIFGMIWIVYFINQIILDENQLVSRNSDIELSELEYPAITICSEQTTKYALAERLGNYLDPNEILPSTLNKLQKDIIKKVMTKYSQGFGSGYDGFCINKLTSRPTHQICEVRINFSNDYLGTYSIMTVIVKNSRAQPIECILYHKKKLSFFQNFSASGNTIPLWEITKQDNDGYF